MRVYGVEPNGKFVKYANTFKLSMKRPFLRAG